MVQLMFIRCVVASEATAAAPDRRIRGVRTRSSMATGTAATELSYKQSSARILIAGGSIGGLAAYSALQKHGFADVHVLEERQQLGGAAKSTGVVVWPSGVRSLRAICPDLAEEVISGGAPMDAMHIRSTAGATLQESSPNFEQRFGEPAVMIEWARLHSILRTRVPADRFHLGQRLSSFRQTPEGTVEATFTGPSGDVVWAGDALLGCDGIRSLVREKLLGVEPPPRDGARVIFRCIVPTSVLPHGIAIARGSAMSLAAGKTGAVMDTGGGTTYCAVGALDEHLAGLPAGATKKERCLAVLRHVESEGGWPFHAAIFSAADEADIREERIIDRPPLDPAALAGAGPVTLLGDALHPMVPSIGFGAVSAIEGALEVAQCFGAGAAAAKSPGKLTSEEIAAVLRRYEGARLHRASAVQLQSFTQGSGSYRWGSSDGGRMPSSEPTPAPFSAPPADGPAKAPAAAAAGAGGMNSEFQTWLQSYRSPWSAAAEEETKVPAPAASA